MYITSFPLGKYRLHVWIIIRSLLLFIVPIIHSYLLLLFVFIFFVDELFCISSTLLSLKNVKQYTASNNFLWRTIIPVLTLNVSATVIHIHRCRFLLSFHLFEFIPTCAHIPCFQCSTTHSFNLYLSHLQIVHFNSLSLSAHLPVVFSLSRMHTYFQWYSLCSRLIFLRSKLIVQCQPETNA